MILIIEFKVFLIIIPKKRWIRINDSIGNQELNKNWIKWNSINGLIKLENNTVILFGNSYEIDYGVTIKGFGLPKNGSLERGYCLQYAIFIRNFNRIDKSLPEIN